MLKHVQAVILAGGKGARLGPLTRERAKPAVPFGGAYRIVDFALSNCLNSGLHRILVLTQYKAASLHRHITLFWQRYFCRERGEYVDIARPSSRSLRLGIRARPMRSTRICLPSRKNGRNML